MSDSTAISNSANRTAVTVRWPALLLPGLAPDTVGNYLASMGLLALAARKWPNLRGCWRNEQFALVNGPVALDDLVGFLFDVAKDRKWSDYGRGWKKAQEADRGKAPVSTNRWRSEATEQELPLFHSHLATGERLSFNPLFGSGGNAGRREFATGWKKAVTSLAGSKGKLKEQQVEDLPALFCGKPCKYLGDFGAGCWFSSANKSYNSGTEKPFREGQVSPWAMVLACEAFPLLMGSTSRQLGTHRGAKGAFPFVTAEAAPESAGEAGRSIGELWLPIWSRPMGMAEITALFGRGRAEIRGRGAITAPAFSAAILQRGVDAGISEFRRFVLFHTTSENTFESRLTSVVPVIERGDDALADAVEVALDLREALPRDRKKGTRWIYAGLRGAVDQAIIKLAAGPDPETACALVDALVTALQKVDRNRSHRQRKVRFQLLPGAWTKSLFGLHDRITPEIRLAFALASLRATQTTPPGLPKQLTAPLLAYWLGAENQANWWTIPESVPLRRVWGGGELATNIVAVLQRRLIEEPPYAVPPFEGRARVGLADIESFLEGILDEVQLTCWLFRFSLFSPMGAGSALSTQQQAGGDQRMILSPPLALFTLFKPLFDAKLIQHRSIGASRPAKVGTLLHIVALLARGDTHSAAQAAREAYHAIGVELANFDCQFNLGNPTHLLASLMVPVRGTETAEAFRRWLLPAKLNRRKEL